MNKIISNEIPSIFSVPASYKLLTGTFLLKKGILWGAQIFSFVDLNYETMLLIKKRKVFNLILSFKSKLNQS